MEHKNSDPTEKGKVGINERNASEPTSSTSLDIPPAPDNGKTNTGIEHVAQHHAPDLADPEVQALPSVERDVFGNEEGAELHYKTCEWWHTGIRKKSIPPSPPHAHCNSNAR
jgi:hypothetical protein